MFEHTYFLLGGQRTLLQGGDTVQWQMVEGVLTLFRGGRVLRLTSGMDDRRLQVGPPEEARRALRLLTAFTGLDLRPAEPSNEQTKMFQFVSRTRAVYPGEIRARFFLRESETRLEPGDALRWDTMGRHVSFVRGALRDRPALSLGECPEREDPFLLSLEASISSVIHLVSACTGYGRERTQTAESILFKLHGMTAA